MNLKNSSRTLAGSLSLAAAISIAASTGLYAAVPETGKASHVSKYPELEQTLKKALPDTPIDDIQPSPIPGIFAVISGRSIIYTDASGKFVINGHMFDAGTKQDLSIDVVAAHNKVDLRALPLADSFTEVRGNGKRQLYVFSDPDCPFCKRLESELPKVNDVTIHVFLYPIVQLHPDAKTDAVAVWCSANREQAWEGKLINDIKPTSASCDNPVERNLALAEKLGINATPTLIFADGKMIPGAMSAERINALLDQSPQ